MRLISLTVETGTMWVDPALVVLIQPGAGRKGSLVTLENNNYFSVEEDPSWVAEKVHTAELRVLV